MMQIQSLRTVLRQTQDQRGAVTVAGNEDGSLAVYDAGGQHIGAIEELTGANGGVVYCPAIPDSPGAMRRLEQVTTKGGTAETELKVIRETLVKAHATLGCGLAPGTGFNCEICAVLR